MKHKKLILIILPIIFVCFFSTNLAYAAEDVRVARFDGVKVFSLPDVNSFVVESLKKDEKVTVLEIEIFDGVEFARVSNGYILSSELLGGEKLSLDLREGARTMGVKNQTKVFLEASVQSEVVKILADNTRLKITEVSGKFCLVEAVVGEEKIVGYVESKYLVTDGFSNSQKLGVVVLISMVILLFITLLIRFKVIK